MSNKSKPFIMMMILMDGLQNQSIEEVSFISGSRFDKAMGLAPTRLAICLLYAGWYFILHVDDELHYDSGLHRILVETVLVKVKICCICALSCLR
jgi:hypothetical protein